MEQLTVRMARRMGKRIDTNALAKEAGSFMRPLVAWHVLPGEHIAWRICPTSPLETV